MDKRHIIEDAEFDISFDSVAAAREHEPGLADFIRERLLPLADEVFCELAEDGMVARIDRLEIDLGDVRSGGFRDEMESRFGEKLRSVLREKMRALATADAPAGSRIDRQQAERGRLESYLETGRMPWHADLATGEAADAMLRQTIEHQADAFVEFLRTTSQRDIVVKRLARQFPDRLLAGVMQLLAPSAALGELTGKLGEICRRQTGGVAEREFKVRLWERLLGECLKTGAPDPARLLGEVAKDLSARDAQPGEGSSRDASPSGKEAARLPDDFMRELHGAAGRLGETSLAASRDGDAEDVPRLRAYLETALGTGDARALSGRWADLAARHRELVREVFMRRMWDVRLQEKVAEGFPESMLLDLLHILSPRDGSLMAALSGLPELRGEEGAKSAVFWTCTLGYLHGSQGGDLAAYARILLDRLPAPGEARRRLVQAIAAAVPELALAAATEESATPQSAGENASADELCRRLVRRLGGASGPDLAQTLAELEREHPESLAQLLRRLQAGELRAEVGAFETREARELVFALVRMSAGAKDGDFMSAIEAQAQQARDRQRYYRYVLERLIRNEAVDLEAATSEATPDDGRSADSADETAARTAWLRDLLDAALTGGNAAELVGAWDEIRTAHAGLVRERFERLMADEGARARVAQGWPTKRLVELARILAPAESDFVETVATQLQTGKNGGTGIARLWQRTLGYLHRARAFDRRAYAESLLRDVNERDADRDDILRAVAHADAALGEALFEAEAQRAGERDEIGIAGESGIAEEPGRADELYRRLAQRLGGASGGADIVAAIEELASAYPETLARLLRQLHAGELRAEVGALDAHEARQLVLALVRLNSGAKVSDFVRAIERYAGRAKNGAGYFRHILDSLLSNRTIDLEAALRSPDATVASDWQAVPEPGEMAAGARSGARQDDREAVAASTFGAEPALETARLQRLRLEEALVLGRAEGVAAIWAELLQNRAGMLREIFILRLGDADARARLANGFPESMLLDLVRALAPSEGGFIDRLAGQPELRAGETVDGKNTPFWEYTLSYLHACGLRGYERTEYARGLVRSLAESEVEAAVLQAVVRADPALGSAMSGAVGATGPDRARAGEKDFSPEATRSGELLRQLLHRLRGPDRALAQEIGELAEAWPEIVSEFYRQLQSGDALDAMTPTAQEAARHVAAFIAASHGRMGDEFRHDIEAHAGKARSERGYYRTVLEMLICNRVVDIEEAMAALPDEEGGAGDAASRTGMRKMPVSAPGPLRIRFESALVQGNAEALVGVWDELRFNRGNLVREVFQRRMGDGAIRKRLADRFPGTMLFDLIRVLAPLASSFIENVEKQLGQQVGAEEAGAIRRTAREHALAYLHAHGARGFRRADYARDLMHRLALQGVENGVVLQAMAAIYPALALSLAGQNADQGDAAADNAAAYTARLHAGLELAFATGDAGGLAAYREALRGEHRDLVREVFMRRMGDARLHKKVAEGFPESMLLDLLNILSPRVGGFMAALSGLPALRGAKSEKNAAFWRYTLGCLHGAQDGGRAEYARGLIRSLSAQGTEQAPLLQALVAFDPDLQEALADMRAQPATLPPAEESVLAAEPARAGELYRRVTQRLNGTRNEPEFAALIEEMASACPETLARLQRQLQSGELRADVGTLDAREAGQMAAALIRLNAGVKENDLLREVEAQAPRARDRRRYYRHILERLIRNEAVDLEAALDEAGNEAVRQPVRSDSVVDAAGSRPSAQQDRQADGREEIARPLAESAEAGRVSEPARAEELYRRVTRRLSGAGGESEFAALVDEMASACPESLARLQRQLQSGELRAQIGVLDAGEARQLAVSLIRLNSGAKESDFLRAVDAQAWQARNRRRYYRYVLERLIRNETVDLEVALGEAAAGNDALPQRPASAGDTALDEESALVQNAVHTPDEVATPARTDYLRALLDTALSGGNAGELVGAWDELRQRHAGLVRESFRRRMGDEGARQRVAQGFPETLLAELVRILAPMESGYIETLAAQLQQEQAGASGRNAPLWKYTMSYLHATASSGFDRRDYVGGLMNCLSEQGASRDGILQAVSRTDAALGRVLSARQDIRADTQEEIARAAAIETGSIETSAIETGSIKTGSIETDRANELYRRVTQRLNGTSGEPEFVALLAEMASACPETLAHLLRQLQAGELRADVGTFDAREAKAVATALIRLNSGARESEFLRAVERYAARAQSEPGYYRVILKNLILDQAIDLEEAASVVSQEAARQISAIDGGEENKALPGAVSGDKHRPQMAEDVRPRATTGDKPMQVENTSASDGRRFEDDSESGEEIYIANAGMVLATPYLPQLFRMLDLTDGAKFKDERSAERAIHLLQFMVSESCDSPEFLLSLNKLMCGVPTGVPIVREIELLPREKEAIEGMLNGIIRNWTILGNTSVQGLRESFLQRSGRLQLKEDNWHLKVEPKGIDVLLDRLPWSFALIKHPWMRRPIYVEWR